MQYDLFAVGDIVIDNFIRLKDARVNCDINDENCMLCVRFGDKIPFESATEVAAVGNASNAAVAAARLGLNAGLRAYVGEDAHGEQCIEALKQARVDPQFVEKQPGKHTNYHFVLWYESERTILIKHESFDYAPPALPEPPRWLYLSSLSENSLPYEQAMMELLEQWPDTKLAFQPGTFQIKFGAEAQKRIYARTEIFFCNKEEAELITGKKTDDVKELLTAIRALGPRIAVITDGRKGAYAMNAEHTWLVPMYPDERPPYERTGAGDAFAATIVCALALGNPLEDALLWGPINAMEVVQKIGAQAGLLTREELQKFLAQAPAEYKLQLLA